MNVPTVWTTRQLLQERFSDQTSFFQDTFEEFENTHAYDGTFSSADDTVDKCRIACLASSTCVAFDFNGGCYHHFNVANLAEINTNANNVKHYRRVSNQNCETATTDVTGRTGGTGETGGTGLPPECRLLNTYEPAKRNTVHADYGTSVSLETIIGRSVAVSMPND